MNRRAVVRLSAWLLFCVSTLAHAELEYRLQPRQIAEDTYLLEGATENFDKRNGGNIVNTGFVVTDSGVVVIDTGPSRRYGKPCARRYPASRTNR